MMFRAFYGGQLFSNEPPTWACNTLSGWEDLPGAGDAFDHYRLAIDLALCAFDGEEIPEELDIHDHNGEPIKLTLARFEPTYRGPCAQYVTQGDKDDYDFPAGNLMDSLFGECSGEEDCDCGRCEMDRLSIVDELDERTDGYNDPSTN